MSQPRDIVAIIVLNRGKEERLTLRGSTPEVRFRHLQDAVRRWDIDWKAHFTGLPTYMIQAFRDLNETQEMEAQSRRRSGGASTAKKMKARASANKALVLEAHARGYPSHIKPRDRASYLAKKTGLSLPTIRKYLPRLKSAPKKSPKDS